MTLLRTVIPYTPRALFRPYHRRTQRWACLVVHRRGGKTVAALNDMIRRAVTLNKVDGRYGFVEPQLNQAKDVVWNYLKRYTAPLMVDKNEAELWVEVPNAAGSVSRIRLYGADNADRIRGGYFDGVIADEFADIAPGVREEIISPMLADRHGWETVIGTIKGRNHLYKLWEEVRDDPEWFTLYAKASETGILDPDEMEIQRRRMTKERYAQEFELDPDAAIVGAYWGEELAAAQAAGRMTTVEPAPGPVHTVWDLGVGDSTAIWFWQAVGAEIRVLDFYENHGQGIEHYAGVVASKAWPKGVDWVPHDAKVRELGTGRTRIETMISHGLKPRLVPDHKVEDGIEAARRVLGRCWFAMPTCRDGVEGLKQYRADYDEKLRVFKDKPRHDWTSHRSDSFRYLAMAYREIAPPPVKEPDRIVSVGSLNSVTLEDMYRVAKRAKVKGARL